MRVVYIDALFLTNLIVNYLLLLASGIFSGLPMNRLRLLLSALLGACYAVVYYFVGTSGAATALSASLSGLAMVLVAFGYTCSRVFIKRVVIFFVVSLFFGGGVMALYNANGSSGIDVKVLLVATFICYGVISLFFKGGARHGGYGGEMVNVTARLGSKEVRFTALVDSGNSLRDPITNSAVMVAELEAVRKLFKRQVVTLLDGDALKDPSSVMSDLSLLGVSTGFRLIPYRALGTEQGLLLVFRPDMVLVDGVEKKNMLIALSPAELSEGAGYCALVGNL